MFRQGGVCLIIKIKRKRGIAVLLTLPLLLTSVRVSASSLDDGSTVFSAVSAQDGFSDGNTQEAVIINQLTRDENAGTTVLDCTFNQNGNYYITAVNTQAAQSLNIDLNYAVEHDIIISSKPEFAAPCKVNGLVLDFNLLADQGLDLTREISIYVFLDTGEQGGAYSAVINVSPYDETLQATETAETEAVTEAISEETTQETTEEVPEAETEVTEMLQETSEAVTEETPEEITEEISEETSETSSEAAAEETTEEVTGEDAEEITEESSEETTEEVTEGSSEETTVQPDRDPIVIEEGDCTIDGLSSENGYDFYPGIYYAFSANGGQNLEEFNTPVIGDTFYSPVYWSTENADDYTDGELPENMKFTHFRVGCASGISNIEAIDVYVYFRKLVYTENGWICDSIYHKDQTVYSNAITY